MNSQMSKSGEGSKAGDELALVKAAAWAWYLRGSGNETKVGREFDPSRTSGRSPRPSRYKLEAVRPRPQTDRSARPGGRPSPLPSPAHSLLDSYEIQSISKQLNYLLEDWSYIHSYVLVDDFDRRKTSPVHNSRPPAGRPKPRGWTRHAAAVCGSRQGVVEAHPVVKGGTEKRGIFPPMGSAKVSPDRARRSTGTGFVHRQRM